MSAMAKSSAGSPTVFFHIGPPKTGTTYLQDLLRHWRRGLREVGVLYPGIPQFNHFSAALDVRGDHGFGIGAGHDVPRIIAAGAWPRLLKKTRSFPGTVVISHEIFATADDEHARCAIEDLRGTDLHLIVTARDPARQLVSSWQETIKHGNTRPFRVVARKTVARDNLAPPQQIPQLLERWGSTLAPDHVHVVTVPPAGSDPALLWERFTSVIGVDAARFDPLQVRRSNESLGVAEIELLRRVNLALAGRLPHPEYGAVATTLFANGILGQLSRSSKPVLPQQLRAAAERLGDDWIEQIELRNYSVSGDLDDLRPHHRDGARPQAASQEDIAEVAAQATAELLLEIAQLRKPSAVARVSMRQAASRSVYAALDAGRRVKRLGRSS